MAVSHTESNPRTVRILGTHGVPANYGGFETAAENIALFLVRQGWRVIVYCQIPGTGAIYEDAWHGIERVNVPVATEGWRGTSKFDLLCIRHACRFDDICLTFGYNTAIFNIAQRLKRIPNVINMDGIEWSRARWGLARQTILYVNERIACFVGNALIADHPEIETFLQTRAPARKITTITYGANPVIDAPTEPIAVLGLESHEYLTLICRPIPENSILELVEGFSRKPRGKKLAILGNYTPAEDSYHRQVREAASDEVVFLGAIYDPLVLEALRWHCVAYMHGHTVGGTNPSLVEAMGAGNAVIAHDNVYNRWVAQDGAVYFTSAEDVSAHLDELLDTPRKLETLREASRTRYESEFTWDHVAGQYEQLLLRYVDDYEETRA
jgi:glycosyltransferase involved in cell wall biosynthesis